MKKFLFLLFFSSIYLLSISKLFAINHAKKTHEIENDFNIDKVKIITKLHNGSNFDISQTQKKTILIFWVEWCHICKKQLKILNKMQSELTKINIQTLGISVDKPQNYDRVKKITDSLSFINTNFYDAMVMNIRQPSAIPTTLLLDENQKIIKIYEGIIDEDKLLGF